ncbi:protein of unknown function [Hyphomicrobium sp. 1Nfss2.1]
MSGSYATLAQGEDHKLRSNNELTMKVAAVTDPDQLHRGDDVDKTRTAASLNRPTR